MNSRGRRRSIDNALKLAGSWNMWVKTIFVESTAVTLQPPKESQLKKGFRCQVEFQKIYCLTSKRQADNCKYRIENLSGNVNSCLHGRSYLYTSAHPKWRWKLVNIKVVAGGLLVRDGCNKYIWGFPQFHREATWRWHDAEYSQLPLQRTM